MKLGIFDSGLGGLFITHAIRQRLPEIDILYYGDTLHLPYGNRSAEAIYDYTCRAMNHMFEQDCSLIVVACNTASAAALRRLQQEYLPANKNKWPGRNIIGVVVPTLEAAIELGYKNLGLIATNFIIQSQIYRQELKKLNEQVELKSVATPLLVPLIENQGETWIESVLNSYFKKIDAHKLEGLILGCTHYPILKSTVQKLLPGVKILAQDEIIPLKLAAYLAKHPGYNVGNGGSTTFQVSDLTANYQQSAERIFGKSIKIDRV